MTKKRAPAGSSPGPSNQIVSRRNVAARRGLLKVRVLPDGEPFTLWGREAQTLVLLLKRPAGFTSGEASPLGWARRTSHYVLRLRQRGLQIRTHREKAGDAVVGRYILVSSVDVIDDGEGDQ